MDEKNTNKAMEKLFEGHPAPWAIFEADPVLLEKALKNGKFLVSVFEKFRSELETDTDAYKEFHQLVDMYSDSNEDYRMAIDAVFVHLCGWSLPTLMKMAAEEPEDKLRCFRLNATVLFNRSIDPDKDSISPGGYEMTFGPEGKTYHFDFEDSELTVDESNRHILHYTQKNPDYKVFPEISHITAGNLADVHRIDEWYIDTDSPRDSVPLVPIAVLDASFLDDKGNVIPISGKTLASVFPESPYTRPVSEGDRVRLIHMPNDPRPVPKGTEGTVTQIDDAGTIHVRWDNGSSLGLIPGVDKYQVLNPSGTKRNAVYEKLLPHRGHKVACVSYGDWDDPADVCIECEDCNEVLISAEDFESEVRS